MAEKALNDLARALGCNEGNVDQIESKYLTLRNLAGFCIFGMRRWGIGEMEKTTN